MAASANPLMAMTKSAATYGTAVVWQTIALLSVCITLLVGSLILAALGSIPVWAAGVINYFALYAVYTVLHEAVHGNIGGTRKGDSAIDRWCGRIAGFVLMVPFSAHKTIHLAHHKNTNHPEHDPDHYIAGKTALGTVARCFTISISYLFYCRRHWDQRAMRSAFWVSLLGFAQVGAILIVLGYFFGWQLPIIGYLIPAALALPTLGFLFDWIVHTPHTDPSRFKNTTVFEGRSDWLDRAYTWATLQQNYHGIHHAFPRIPFIQYREFFKANKDVLEEKGMPVVNYGP